MFFAAPCTLSSRSDPHPQHGGASANAGTRDRHHQRMRKVIKMPIVKIATAVGRHKKSIYKVLKTRKVLSRGRAPSLSSSEARHVITVLKQLISKAKTRYEVTLSVVKRRPKRSFASRPSGGHWLQRVRAKDRSSQVFLDPAARIPPDPPPQCWNTQRLPWKIKSPSWQH